MKINISLRDAKRGKCFVLRYCGIGWMDLLNNCHSVSAEPERRGCKSLKHGSKKEPGDV